MANKGVSLYQSHHRSCSQDRHAAIELKSSNNRNVVSLAAAGFIHTFPFDYEPTTTDRRWECNEGETPEKWRRQQQQQSTTSQ